MAENNQKFYITTTLPYVNSSPHLGFALELVQADVIARYHREVLGEEVFFNTGTDEHGQKVYQKAQEQGADTQKYVNEYAQKFKQLLPALNILSDINFIRTTDKHHVASAQEFWKLCDAKGDIYKKNYKIKYCVGCELEKTESDLDATGHCLIHPHLEMELIDEENYFFRWSKYQQSLLDFYKANPNFVVPDFRFNEIKAFVERGLEDFSISRLKTKMSWGVPVPGDDQHVMYVWFDALVNYVSALGWPENADESTYAKASADGLARYNQGGVPIYARFVEFWGTLDKPNAIQIAGKDNLRQQSAMWQAMLMSAGLPNTKQIIIHGFINSGGQKMAKSLGNVADPYEILEKLESKGLTSEQATDALRYYLTREISTFEDGDYTWEHFVETYNAGLANGIGNLTSRILKMAVTNNIQINVEEELENVQGDVDFEDYRKSLDSYQLQRVTNLIWRRIQGLDQFIQVKEPFKIIKTDFELAKSQIESLLRELVLVSRLIQPFFPHTSQQILQALKNSSAENIPRLFPRILDT